MSASVSAPRTCPTSLRYDEPNEGGAYCSGGARTEVLQECCAFVEGRYDCMKNKCYMPEDKQSVWRLCIQTEVFVCTASPARRTKAQVLALALGVTVALLGIAAGS